MGSRSIVAVGSAVAPYLAFIDNDTGVRYSPNAFAAAYPPSALNACAFSADGRYFAVTHNTTASGSIIVYDMVAEAQVVISDGGLAVTKNKIKFSPDGSHLAVTVSGNPGVQVYRTDTWGLVTLSSGIGSTGYGCDWSPDGTLLAVAGHSNGATLTVYNTETWEKITISGGVPATTGINCRFNPDGSRLAVACGQNPALVLYNTVTWAKVPLTGGAPGTDGNSCAWSPDGTLLAVVSASSQYLTIYNTTTLEKVTISGGQPTGPCNQCEFSIDGDLLYVTHNNAPGFVVYDADTWAKVTTGWSPGTCVALAVSERKFGGTISNADTTPVVDALGATVQRRVVALRRSDMLLVAETATGVDGRYELPLLTNNPVTVVFQAANALENSVVVDWVTPE